MEKTHQKSVLITGCDLPSSYGYELALCLDKQGYTVFAGCADCNCVGARSMASRGSSSLAILQMNVTKQDEIDDAKEMIEDLVGDEGIWAVVNCAESYTVAEVDWCAVDDFDQIMQINFLGAVKVTKAVLPLLRRAKGRIVNLSSVSGYVSRAGQAAFAASKFALEAFSDSLRQEMMKWGVFVTIVQPAFLPNKLPQFCKRRNSKIKQRRFNSWVVRLSNALQEKFSFQWHLVDGIMYRQYHIISKQQYYFNNKRKLHSDNQVSETVLSDPETSERLKKVPRAIQDVYGDDYFVKYIRSLSTATPEETYNDSSSEPTKAENNANVVNRQRKIADVASKNTSDASETSSKQRDSPSTSASSTLKPLVPPNWNLKNRVLHALVEATTTSSPKKRYFVGTFQDKMLKSLSSIVPAVFLDAYFTSGKIAKVVPKHIKEKWE